jgi:hypothetical protein
MAQKRRVSLEAIEKTLRDTYGTVTVAAQRLGISRRQLYRRIARSSRLRETLEDAREVIIDTAELKLIQAIQNGEAWAISMTLKTIGRHRGYVERQEVDNLRDLDLSSVSTEQLRAWLSAE